MGISGQRRGWEKVGRVDGKDKPRLKFLEGGRWVLRERPKKNVGQAKEVGAGNFENFHPGARAKGSRHVCYG